MKEKNALSNLVFHIAEAPVKDVGHGIARMDPNDMKLIGAAIGDIIEIRKDKQTAVAKLMPVYTQDRGKNIIQIDGILRENAKASIDEKVNVNKATYQNASRITLQRLQLASLGDNHCLGRLFAGIPVTKNSLIRAILFGPKTLDFEVVETLPKGTVLITHNTVINVISPESDAMSPEENCAQKKRCGTSYEDIGGLQTQIQRIREMIEIPLKYPQVFNRLGITPPKGVLLCGPPGTGKTLIARALAHETKTSFYSINGPEIIHKFYGESESHLKAFFDKAIENSPSIIFIDEIDSIAPKRVNVQGEVEKRVVATLLAQMDGLKDRGQVIVIGATNIPDVLDPALRRPGRFDREIYIGIPDRKGREEILNIHTRGMPLTKDVDLKKLAESTHAYVGADLEALVKEAAMNCLRSVFPNLSASFDEIPIDKLLELEVSMCHFTEALKEIKPSALREVFVEIPDITWNDIGGLDHIKSLLQETIQWPLQYAPLFEKANVSHPKGIILEGPPGTGKTLLVKALANESHVNFISIKGPELMNKYVGEAEKGVREIFKRAKNAAPCIIFFDEIDSLVSIRSAEDGDSGVRQRLVSQFLTEIDGIEELQGVLIIGATNRKDLIDPALLRTGRFDFIVNVGLPDREARKKIFSIHTKKMPLDSLLNLDVFIDQTEKMTGSDIEAICHRGAMNALRDFVAKHQGEAILKKNLLKITEKHFADALKKIKEERT
ncbi:MAG: CDC48 family AAA ATPase [Chlamydiota bacterium]